MPRDSITAFVAGATGYQGGATARQLLNAGVQVHALVRDTSSKAAIDLQAQGAQLFLGDFNNTMSLKAAISGASAIFLNVTPDPLDPSLEVKRAKNIIDAAKESGSVSTMIYSSVEMTGKARDISELGAGISSGMVLDKQIPNRDDAFLMNNYHQPKASSMFPELVTNCVFLTAYNPNTRMTMVDPGDVGKFAAAAVLESLRFNRCEIDLGAESLKPADIVRGLSLASGKEIALKFYSRDEAERRAASDPRL
ncbi:nmrA-like family domain-containing protein DDB_G0286605 [Aspergillus udagawae]|nr:nmrA-like family domain-containing protein DDB_G0286605 [Aspergillus udagawae]